jgi:WD40 repeat protein
MRPTRAVSIGMRDGWFRRLCVTKRGYWEKHMKRFLTAALVALAVIVLSALLSAQQGTEKSSPTKTIAKEGNESGTEPAQRPLVLSGSVPMDGVKGRFDHFASGKGRVFISALGNNTVEVINLFGGIVEHTITDVTNPQGVAFSPDANKLFVASAQGKLYIYDGDSFSLITTLDFEGGVDNLRYDAATKRVYVGCGDDEKNGAIAAVDAMTNQRLDEEYKIGGEPESFQLEKSGPNIYVNIPDLQQVAVINRQTKKITRWPLMGLRLNFPMALDEADHRLFVGIREPARLAVFDTTSGHMIAALPSAEDTDDLYYDAEHKRIYVPGGEGLICVFQMSDPDHYRLIAKIPTALGGRTAGYFGRQGKGFHRFFLAVPSRGGQSAEVRIYTIQE